MGHLDDRVAIVTGAGRGVGAAVARLFASEGAKVVVADRGVALDGTGQDNGPAQQTVDEITKAGGTAMAQTGDISNHSDAEQLVRTTIDAYGKLDVLVNVAGILRDRMIFNMAEDEWDAVLAVHLKGVFNTSKFAAAYWRDLRDENAHHRIINFTSEAGLHGSPGQPNYSAAKLGMVGLTYSCANALRRYGVTSNCISPRASTRMTDSIPAERGGLRASADERAPENVAPATAYLASVRSDWCNGQVIRAWGYEMSLYNVPAVIRQIVSPGPWNLDAAFDQIERYFQQAATAEPRR